MMLNGCIGQILEKWMENNSERGNLAYRRGVELTYHIGGKTPNAGECFWSNKCCHRIGFRFRRNGWNDY